MLAAAAAATGAACRGPGTKFNSLMLYTTAAATPKARNFLAPRTMAIGTGEGAGQNIEPAKNAFKRQRTAKSRLSQSPPMRRTLLPRLKEQLPALRNF